MKTTFIYELIDPRTNEVRYIGKSNRPEYRLKNGHLGSSELKNKTYKNNWIKKLKEENLQPILNIIDEVNRNEWEYWEKFYIGAYKAIGCNLTNGTKGGDGFDIPWNKGLTRKTDKRIDNIAKLKEGKILSKETKEKKSKSLKGRKFSKETKEKMSESQKLRKRNPEIAHKVWETRRKNGTDKVTEERKERISKTLTGTKQSEESKLKKSLKLTGIKRSEETKQKISLAQKGKIVTEETKSKLRKPKSEETKLKMRKSKLKKNGK